MDNGVRHEVSEAQAGTDGTLCQQDYHLRLVPFVMYRAHPQLPALLKRPESPPPPRSRKRRRVHPEHECTSGEARPRQLSPRTRLLLHPDLPRRQVTATKARARRTGPIAPTSLSRPGGKPTHVVQQPSFPDPSQARPPPSRSHWLALIYRGGHSSPRPPLRVSDSPHPPGPSPPASPAAVEPRLPPSTSAQERGHDRRRSTRITRVSSEDAAEEREIHQSYVSSRAA